jgi:organic hydroperoxide reductase OsmC/OhrA
LVAKQKKRDATKAKITCAASIGPREAGGIGIAVKMRVDDTSFAQTEVDALVGQAHEEVCPYSHATGGKVEVGFSRLPGTEHIRIQECELRSRSRY